VTITAAHIILIILALAGGIVAVFGGGKAVRLGELTYGAAFLALCLLLAGIR
jgi:hypothetical protein